MFKSEIKKILNKLDIRIQKRLGQHFLIDQRVVRDMISAADLKKDDCVLEVGPGLGILTEAIAGKAKKVFAVEKDQRLLEFLKEKFRNYKNIEIIHGDILRLQANKLQVNKLVANLPFYLTSRFLRLCLESKTRPELAVLLIQKEVAERVVAKPGDMSLLSISCQLYSEPKIISLVLPKSFFLPPEVDCAVLKLRLFKQPKFKIKDIKSFFRIVKAGFAGKRKQLHNTLSAGLLISDDAAKEILKESLIEPSRRPQTLSLEEWVGLCENLKRKAKN
jgi:16S rRNA (adenine1518-N6/adenine1519-N6)-dimethyltransferase